MAKRKVWIGSVGPSIYDDDNFAGLWTNGVVRAEGTPTDPDDLVRLVDLAPDEDLRYAFMLSVT